MTPLDKMSAALALSQSGEDCFEALEPEAQEALRENVRAVLGAIREPTPGMLSGDVMDAYEGAFERPETAEQHMIWIWQSMLNAALSE